LPEESTAKDLPEAMERYRRAAEENAIVAEIGHAVGAPGEVELVYQRFADQLGRLIDFDRLAISLQNVERGTNIVEFFTGTRVGPWARGFEFPSAGFIEERCLAQRGAVTFPFESEAQVAAEMPGNLAGYREGIRSMMAAPLIVEDRVLGVISVGSKSKAAYGKQAEDLFEKLANLIAPPVANAQLKKVLEAQTREIAAVSAIGRTISSSLNIDEVFSQFGREVRNVVDADRVTINLVDHQRRTLTIAYSSGAVIGNEAWATNSVVPLDGTIDDEAVESMPPTAWDLTDPKRPYFDLPASLAARGDGISAVAAVPLVARDAVIGVLSVAAAQGRTFRAEQLRLLQAVGNQVAGAVANSLLYDRFREAEDAVRRSDERLRSLVAAAAEGIVTYDELGMVESANTAAEDMFGLKPGGMQGNSLFGYLKFAHEHETGQSPSPDSTRAHSLLRPLSGVRTDGTEFPVEMSTSSFPLGGRTIFTAILRDVTEHQRAQGALVRQVAADARAGELVASRRRMVQAQESLRRDIAQQLHGTVQNRMIVVANRLVELADAGASETELSELSKIVIALIDDDLRPMSHQLYPSILRRGLVPAVQTVAESVEPAKALTLEIDERLQRSERSDRNYIPYDIRLGCYRVAEEAVTNLLKHSAASEVHITLARESNLLTLWVEDNGRGFDTAASANSIGLAVMRDFAEVNGGSCTVTSRPGDGTRVSARFPLPRPAK
jgi:PAS domain S-box-containing protein